MGTVLSFSPRGTTASHRQPPNGQVAAVIIFPGVRYESLPAQRATAADTGVVVAPASKKPSH